MFSLIKKTIWAGVFMLSNLITYPVATACKYTVRETGFTDLGTQPYLLNVYVDDITTDSLINIIRSMAYISFSNTIIETNIIQTGKDTVYEKLLDKKHIVYPTSLLLSPIGEKLIIPLNISGSHHPISIGKVFQQISHSPTRQKVLEACISSLAVILFIEGDDKERNQIALRVVKNTLQDVLKVMHNLPKEVANPPEMIKVPRQRFKDELYLLYSIGYDPVTMLEPAVAVIYGRGRMMGSMLYSQQINVNYLFNLISIVGADCECNLDNSWKLGRMLLFQWDEDLQKKTIRELGVDVENPFVKAEMAQMLSAGFYQSTHTITDRSEIEAGFSERIKHRKVDLNAILGYQESIEIIEKKSDVPRLTSSQIQQMQQNQSLTESVSYFGLISGIIVMIITSVVIFFCIKKK